VVVKGMNATWNHETILKCPSHEEWRRDHNCGSSSQYISINICTYVGILAAREGWCLGCTILPSHPTLSSLVALLDAADVDYRRGQSFAMSSMTFLMDSANKQQQFQTKVFWRWVPLCKMLWKCALTTAISLQALQKPTKVLLAILFDVYIKGVLSWMLGM